MNFLSILSLKYDFLSPLIKKGLKVLIFIFVIFGVYTWFRPNPNGWKNVSKLGISMPLKYPLHGIDVSHHNGIIDWESVKKMQFSDGNLRLKFCFLKATEGMKHSDKQFERNWKKLEGLGIKRGAYHFFVPWREPRSQAMNFINAVTLKKGDFAPVLDIEQNSLKSDSQIVSEIKIWLDIVQKHYGKKPIIYTNPNFYKKFIKGNFEDYPLWMADYSKETLKGYGSSLWFWQHNQKGWCEGVKGTVDYNVFLGSEEDLNDLCL